MFLLLTDRCILNRISPGKTGHIGFLPCKIHDSSAKKFHLCFCGTESSEFIASHQNFPQISKNSFLQNHIFSLFYEKNTKKFGKEVNFSKKILLDIPMEDEEGERVRRRLHALSP